MNFPMLKATRGTIMLFVVIFVPRQKKNNNAVLCHIIVDHVLYEELSSFPEMTLIAYKICRQPDLLAPNQTTYRNKEQLFS